MSISDFEQRRNRILKLIIEAYVSTASPVGSELVARKLHSSLSPATIRNIMGQLEEAGLLEQPHTSAGRRPTERGYRFYVDAVMDIQRVPMDVQQRMAGSLEGSEFDLHQVLARAIAFLAELTHQAAFVVVPTVKHSIVKQIELVPLSVRKVLCVLVANKEMVASHIVEIEEPIARDEMMALARFINTELVGLSFSELLGSLERRILSEHDAFYYMVKRSLDILQHALSIEPEERFLLDGASYVVIQPEFSHDPHKAHDVLRGLDRQDLLLERLRQDIPPRGVRVRIGHEVQVPGLEECSYLTAPFAVEEEVLGGLGVLGPKRMDYPRLHALLEGMAGCVTDLLNRWDHHP